jgi:glycosyltransferase involved in cell wall biosynthesis
MWRRYAVQSRRRQALPAYQAVIVASRHMAAEFSRHGVAPERLHIVPLPVTDVAPDLEPPVGRSYSGTIMMVGRLTKLKGADHLIRAVPRAARALGSPMTISIAGIGPDRADLERLARRADVSVAFHDWLDGERRTAMMRAADLLAVPSVWPEPFGLVGVEAGCVGLPAVAYDVGGIADWLVPGRSGELAPGDPPTVDGLADAIVRALEDPARHARLRRGAWEIAGRFTLAAHLGRLEPLLFNVADHRT